MSLHLFIHPPFGEGQNGWKQQQKFDVDHYYVRAEAGTEVALGVVYACFDGTLSVCPPRVGDRDVRTPVDVTIAAGGTLPARISVFLHNNGYDALVELRNLLRDFLGSDPGDFDLTRRWRDVPLVLGAAYANLETSSLLKYLRSQLQASYKADKGEKVSDDNLLQMFVQGEIDLQVSGGGPIGQAAPGTGGRHVSFTILTDQGPMEPSHFYQENSSRISGDPAGVTSFLQAFPVTWPLISSQLSREDALSLVKTGLYPYSALVAFKNQFQLSNGEWRLVGDYQKTLYLRRLLRRSGHAPADWTDPDFSFNDNERYGVPNPAEPNLFQLEAVVEFYANHDEPWGGQEPRRAKVLEGTNAVLDASDATKLTLESPIPGIKPFISRMFLQSETARASRTFLIVEVEDQTVTLDGAAQLDGGNSAWRIFQGQYPEPEPGSSAMPAGVSVLSGAQAEVDAAHPNRVSLGDDVDLSHVKPIVHRIVLSSDEARSHRTFLITRVDRVQRRLTVDGEPSFTGPSEWMIDLYISVDFLPLTGESARVSDPGDPRTLRLDGVPDLYRVWPNRTTGNGSTADTSYLYDTIHLDTGNYRILSVDPDTFTVTLATDPQLAGATSRWHIKGRPTLVLVDPFGARKYGTSVVLRGDEARLRDPANLRVLTLDQPPDLSVAIAATDILVLGATEYAIQAIDPEAHSVTLDRKCAQTGILHWRIVRPSGGQRINVLNGQRAFPDAADKTIVKLSNPPDLRRCNPCFDTIYLPADEQAGRSPRKTYRIIAVNDRFSENELPTVEVSEETQLAGGASAWEIQAGVGGELPGAPIHLIGPGTKGLKGDTDYRSLWDHYDGIMFHVFDGELKANVYCWSTFSSRDIEYHVTSHGGHAGMLSSIRGNQLYFYRGRHSSTLFINYAFEIVDPAPFADIYTATTIREARHYFGDPREYPFAHAAQPSNNRQVIADPLPGVQGDTSGKGDVIIHQGNRGPGSTNNGSAGCLVSYRFNESLEANGLRKKLIEIYRDEVPESFGTSHRQRILDIRALSHTNGPNSVPTIYWDNKLVGRLWVIRPDELPLGAVHNLPE